jgi:hypothetical protein
MKVFAVTLKKALKSRNIFLREWVEVTGACLRARKSRIWGALGPENGQKRPDFFFLKIENFQGP